MESPCGDWVYITNLEADHYLKFGSVFEVQERYRGTNWATLPSICTAHDSSDYSYRFRKK